jgi:hypothetical protein
LFTIFMIVAGITSIPTALAITDDDCGGYECACSNGMCSTDCCDPPLDPSVTHKNYKDHGNDVYDDPSNADPLDSGYDDDSG